CEVSAATRKVQYGVSGPDRGLLDRDPLPPAVRPAGHQVVHQVVAAGDRVEYRLYPARLVARVDGGVPEMGLVGHLVHPVTAAALSWAVHKVTIFRLWPLRCASRAYGFRSWPAAARRSR